MYAMFLSLKFRNKGGLGAEGKGYFGQGDYSEYSLG
jgi:hypothetical protein